jgi:hypothetical protein
LDPYALSLGIKGALPLTSTSDLMPEAGRRGGQTGFQLKRGYTAGVTVEIGLPFGLRFEADALYQHAGSIGLGGG